MKVNEIITNRLISIIEEKKNLIWQKGWVPEFRIPMNYISKKPYHGINRIICSVSFNDPYYLTFKQINSLGGSVIKNEKPIPVVYWNWMHFDDEGNKVEEAKAKTSIPFLRYYNVYNATQIEGITFEYPESPVLPNNEKLKLCEDIIKKQKGLIIRNHDRSRAYYMPALDIINVPLMEQFISSEHYYSTLFHELMHWTGHESRINRFPSGTPLPKFGSEDYSKEELIAEMGASFLCEHTQIFNNQLTYNSAAYIKGWLKTLKSDANMIIYAGTQAQKAFDYIIN